MNLQVGQNSATPDAKPVPVADPLAAAATAGRARTKRAEKRRPNLRPLASLLPYVKRYRGGRSAAFGALILAALTTLIVPVAVRRMIDFGFSARGIHLINSYFLVMIGVAAVLALSSSLRYYLVTTLGERIVADLRGDVFAHVTGCRLPSSMRRGPAKSSPGLPPTPRRSRRQSAVRFRSRSAILCCFSARAP